MKLVQAALLAAAIGLAANLSTQTPTAAQTPAASSSSETPKPTAATKIKTWTRARLAAAKKRWDEDNIKFIECSKQLKQQQKIKRLSMRRQRHFLQECMTRRPSSK